MPTRFLHVSDLHVGGHDEGRAEIEAAVIELVTDRRPELVIATGDLTHRNRREQFERGATFLRSLGPPVVAIPGNHDIPALPPARYVRPFAHFEETWTEAERTFQSDGVAVCALNSVRPWKWQRGALRRQQLDRVATAFEDVRAETLRVVALHHHIAGPPWRTGKRSIPHRLDVLAALADARTELVLSGHTHQSVLVEQREFLFRAEAPGGLVLAVAPGLGNPRPGRDAEARGFHLFEVTDDALSATTYSWTSAGLVAVAERIFPRLLPR